MKHLLSILFLIVFIWSFSQDTINERYDFNYNHTIFGSVQSSDSAYYVKSTITNYISAVKFKDAFIKFNLDGTLDTLKILEFDSLGVNSWESPNFIKTNDGGFAQFVRTVSNTQEGFMFIKYNELGDTIKTNYITDFNQLPTYDSKKPYTFLQNPDSSYVGVASINDHVSGVYSYSGIIIYKLNKNGELLWFKTIFNDNLSYYPFLGGNDLIQYNDTLMILVSREIHTVNLNNEYISRFKLFFMDTLANVVDTRTYNQDSIMTVNASVKTFDGGLLYCGSKGRYDSQTNGLWYKGLITKLDSNFDIQWQLPLGDWLGSYFYMHLENLVKVSDNEYVAVGINTNDIYTDTLIDGSSFGWLVKFNLQGEVLWERKFNKVPNPHDYSWPKHELLDVKMTKDSGFVMVGQSINYHDDIPGHPKGQLGWLVKTDKYGCLVPGCQLYDNVDTTKVDTTDTTVWVSEPVELYPNPASTNLFYYFAQPTDDFKPCIAQIFNLQGQLIQEFNLSTNHVTYMIDVSQYAAGTYIFKVITPQQEILKTTRFLVVH